MFLKFKEAHSKQINTSKSISFLPPQKKPQTFLQIPGGEMLPLYMLYTLNFSELPNRLKSSMGHGQIFQNFNHTRKVHFFKIYRQTKHTIWQITSSKILQLLESLHYVT